MHRGRPAISCIALCIVIGALCMRLAGLSNTLVARGGDARVMDALSDRAHDDAAARVTSSIALAADVDPVATGKHKVCGVTRVQNRAPQVIQWIEYHALAGISHFYIVNDCSSDNSTLHDVLGFYSRAAGLVDYWPSPALLLADAPPHARGTDRELYAHDDNNCTAARRNHTVLISRLVRVAKLHCEWILVFDVDEYVTAGDQLAGGVHVYLNTRVRARNGTFSKALPWMYMGTEGFETHPRHKLVIEAYTHGRFIRPEHVKTVAFCLARPALTARGQAARADDVHDWVNAHCPVLRNAQADDTCSRFVAADEIATEPITGCRLPDYSLCALLFLPPAFAEAYASRHK